MATGPATSTYHDRFHEQFGEGYFRPYGDSVVSSIGLGTYLGDPTDAVDARYRNAITTAIDSGINVLDTAINYRCQRSERVIGEAIRAADVDRDTVVRNDLPPIARTDWRSAVTAYERPYEELFVATKGGFLPFDGEQPADP